MNAAAMTEALTAIFLSEPAWLACFHVASSVCIIAPLLLVLKLNKRWSAVRRHQLCQGAAIGLLLVSITPLLPAVPTTLASEPASLTFAAMPSGVAHPDFSGLMSAPNTAGVANDVAGMDRPTVIGTAPIPKHVLLWLWLSTSACLIARLLLHAGRSFAIIRNATMLQPQPEGCSAPVLVSDRITSPITAGLFFPRIVLPAGFSEWVTPQLYRAALRHEDAHARRRDNLDELFYRVLIALFWFNPLLFALNRQRVLHREAACDDYACAGSRGWPGVHSGIDKRDYSHFLIDMASRDAAPSAHVGMRPQQELAARIEALFSATRSRDRKNATAGTIALATIIGLVCSTALLAAPRLIQAPTPDAPIEEPASTRSVQAAGALTSGTVTSNMDRIRRIIAERRAASAQPSNATEEQWLASLNAAVLSDDLGDLEAVLAERANIAGALYQQSIDASLTTTIETRSMRAFDLLVDAGANWRGSSPTGFQLLSKAIHEAWPDMVQKLLELGAEPDGSIGTYSILVTAAKSKDPRSLALLVAAGADLDQATDPPEYSHEPATTPLMAAIELGRQQAIQMLLEAGANPNRGVFRKYPSGTELLVTPLQLARVQQHQTKQSWVPVDDGTLATMLLAAGAAPVDAEASVAEILNAQNTRDASGPAALARLSEDDRGAIQAAIEPLADDDPVGFDFAQSSYQSFRHQPGLGGKFTLKYSTTSPRWAISNIRNKAYQYSCESEPGSGEWDCRIIGTHIQQRLGFDDCCWMTVDPGLSEQDAQEIADFVSRFDATYQPRSIQMPATFQRTEGEVPRYRVAAYSEARNQVDFVDVAITEDGIIRTSIDR